MLEPPMTVVLFVCTYFDGNLSVKCCYNSICIWCKSYFVVSFVDRRNRSENMWLLDDIYDVCSMFMCETKQQQQQLHTHFCDFLLFSGWHNNAFAENLFENQEEKKRTVANILHSHTKSSSRAIRPTKVPCIKSLYVYVHVHVHMKSKHLMHISCYLLLWKSEKCKSNELHFNSQDKQTKVNTHTHTHVHIYIL